MKIDMSFSSIHRSTVEYLSFLGTGSVVNNDSSSISSHLKMCLATPIYRTTEEFWLWTSSWIILLESLDKPTSCCLKYNPFDGTD